MAVVLKPPNVSGADKQDAPTERAGDTGPSPEMTDGEPAVCQGQRMWIPRVHHLPLGFFKMICKDRSNKGQSGDISLSVRFICAAPEFLGIC